MLVGEKIFMVVVEEMSISKAANRSFVTQQCVSDHIKRLEEEHGIELFTRRPRLKLTDAGKELYETLCEVKSLEERLDKKIEKIKGESRKKLTIGVNGTRINVILSNLLREYHEFFPKVIISFILKDTRELEQHLLAEEIDMILDLNTQGSPQFNIHSIGEDKLHFLISENLYKKYLSNYTLEELEEGVTLDMIKDIPLVSSAERTSIHEVLLYYAKRDKVDLNILYYTGDYETQIALCSSNLAAAVCPTVVTKRVQEYDESHTKNNLYLFPLKNQTQKLKIQLVTNKDMVQEEYIIKFIEIVQKMFKKEYK